MFKKYVLLVCLLQAATLAAADVPAPAPVVQQGGLLEVAAEGLAYANRLVNIVEYVRVEAQRAEQARLAAQAEENR